MTNLYEQITNLLSIPHKRTPNAPDMYLRITAGFDRSFGKGSHATKEHLVYLMDYAKTHPSFKLLLDHQQFVEYYDVRSYLNVPESIYDTSVYTLEFKLHGPLVHKLKQLNDLMNKL